MFVLFYVHGYLAVPDRRKSCRAVPSFFYLVITIFFIKLSNTMNAKQILTAFATGLGALFAAESSAAVGDDNVISMHYDEVNNVVYFDDSKVTFDGVTYQFFDDDGLGIDYTIGTGTVGLPTAIIITGGHFEPIAYDDTKATHVVLHDKLSSWWGAQPILPGMDNKSNVVSFLCRGLDVYFSWDKSLHSGRDFPVTDFSSGLFRGNKNIESVVIPGHRFVLESSFEKCTNLKDVEILDGCLDIMYNAFYGCEKLEKIILPASLETIGTHAFDGCSSIKSLWIPDKCFSIGSAAFQGCKSLETIHFPDSLIELGGWAFNNCEKLTAAIIPGKIMAIKGNTFNSCENLSTLSLPSTLEEIGDNAFIFCRKLSHLELPDSLRYIGYGAFWGGRFDDVFIPSKVVSIGEDVFGGNDSLSSIVVADDNETFDSRDNCNAVIEKTTNTLVSGCKNTIIPESVESIRWNSFSCITIDSVFIPKNVHSIVSEAFRACQLNTILVSEENKIFDSRNDCNAIIETATNKLILGGKNTKIPDGIIEIGQHAFHNVILYSGSPNSVIYYRDVTIPQGVERISDFAFYCAFGIGTLSIPSSVFYIGAYAFKESVKYAGIVKSFIQVPFEIPENAFSNYESITLYVPKGTKVNYESTVGWNKFQNIVEMDNTVTDLSAMSDMTSSTPRERYTLSGNRITTQCKGLNIVRMTDGSVRKVMVK